MLRIRTIDDIRALESQGLDAVYPHRSPARMLEAAAARWPGRPALKYLHDPADPGQVRTFTYADLLARIRAAAQLFREAGVQPGRSVALLTAHTPSAQIALWGAQLAGCACPINPMLRADHVAALIAAGDAAVVVAMGCNGENDFWSSLVPALRAEGVRLPIFDCDSDGPSPGSDGCFEDLVSERLGAAGVGSDAQPDEATAALYHTGGTTGAPKLVRHARSNEAHAARSCALLHGYAPEDVVVNGFPLFHVAGAFVYGLSVLSAGGALLLPGRQGMRNAAFIGAFWEQVETHAITVLGAVPTVLSGLLGQPVKGDISTLRVALTGGSPLPPELADDFEKRTGVPVRNILGMTETSGAIALESVHGERVPLSCGFPLPFSRVAVLPHAEGVPDPAHPLGPGETGIVAVRGPNVSAGYTDARRNEGVFLDGGWLVTGDLGRVDEAGRLYITGRAKDVIIRGSHNIDPQGIEDALLAHPDVESAAAVGMPDSYAGELPVAFVTLRPGRTGDADALRDFLRARIDEPAALPKRIEIIPQMPLTPVGKIFKPDLRRQAIRWAVTAAAERLAVDAASFDLEVDAALEVRIAADGSSREKLERSLVGMPVRWSIGAREAEDD